MMTFVPRVAPRRAVAAIVLCAAVAACGATQSATSPPTSGNGAAGTTVNATPAIVFTPPTIPIPVGGTVTFAFGTVGHNVFFDGAPAGAPPAIDGVNANSSLQRTFNTSGVYKYNCHIHPGMHGTVVVGNAVDSTMHADTSYYSRSSTVR